MLEFVVADLADAHVLLLAAYRDPELEPGDPTAAALADVARRASARIVLTGLRPPEVASYIELSANLEPPASLVAAIAAETEGNPLFVGEIVRLLAADGRLDAPADASWRPAIPETVKEVIGRRLNRLSPECIETLALASVLGREFPLDLLERLSGRPAGELLTVLGEAIAARLVTDVPGSPGRLRFTHALVRDTLYDTLAPARRLDLHRRTGEAIEAVAGPEPAARLSELAHHFFQALPAVDPDVAVGYARRAADQAGVLLAHEEAARLHETALHALGLRSQPDRDVERALLLRLAESLARSGDMPNARDAFLRAAAIARATGAAEDLAAAAIGYGGRIVWVRAAGDVLVVSLLEEALAALGEEDTPLRARLLARLAGALRDERDPAHRREVAALAVETARRTADVAALTYALAGLCASEHGIGNEPARLAVTAELEALAHATGDKEAECEALMAQALVHFDICEIAAVRERAARLAALADELRQPAHRWFSLAIQAMLAVYEGRLVDAEQLVPSAANVGARAGSQVEGAYALQLYELRRHQGRASEAYELLASFAAKTPARPVFRCALARLSAELERRAEARQLFEELASNGFEVIPRDNEWMLALSYLVDVCRALGDTTRAPVLYDLLAPFADRTAADVPEGCAGSVARLLGILAVMLERDDAAVAHLEAAIATDVAAGTRPWAAHSQLELAELLDRRGEHEACCDSPRGGGRDRCGARLAPTRGANHRAPARLSHRSGSASSRPGSHRGRTHGLAA
jgi:predicted ATPase